jgi:hypothetical protein
MDEVLAPRVDGGKKVLRLAYESSFAGMTREPVELSALDAARERLFAELPRRLAARQRRFLVGLARAEPDWSLVECPHASSSVPAAPSSPCSTDQGGVRSLCGRRGKNHAKSSQGKSKAARLICGEEERAPR